MLLIGAVGSHLSTLCKLALHVADVPIHKMDTSKRSNFFDGLRSAVRLCGSEGKILSLLFTVSQMLIRTMMSQESMIIKIRVLDHACKC